MTPTQPNYPTQLPKENPMLNRIKRNLPIVAINGALSLFVVFTCAAIGTQDLRMGALLSLGLALIFAPTLLALLVVDAVCYHFSAADKLCAAYDGLVCWYYHLRDVNELDRFHVRPPGRIACFVTGERAFMTWLREEKARIRRAQ